MSSPLTETNSYDATVVAPDVGDPMAIGPLRTAMGSLANRTKNLDARVNAIGSSPNTWTAAQTFDDVTISGTNKVKLAARSITRVQQLIVSANEVSFLADTEGSYLQQGAFGYLAAPVRIPHGATLTAVALIVQGASGHAALPTAKPSMAMKSMSTAGAVVTIGSTPTDPSGTVAAYEAVHQITLSGLNEVIDRVTKRYFVYLTGEGGTNFIAGYKVLGVSVTYTISAMDED